jgi:uncharacterized protein (DUF3820 family)
MNDESVMPLGKYKGEKMANIPPDYLIWLYENAKVYGDVMAEIKDYIKDNLDVLKAEIEYKNKNK